MRTRRRARRHVPNTSSPGLNWVTFFTKGFDLAGNIMTQSCVLWCAQPGEYANEVRRASKEPVDSDSRKPLR